MHVGWGVPQTIQVGVEMVVVDPGIVPAFGVAAEAAAMATAEANAETTGVASGIL